MIRRLRAICAISDHGSFAAAARALGLTQSTLSMQVATLERELGAKLFDRRRRPPRETDAGRVATAHARAILSEWEAMMDTLSEQTETGFRLGVIPTALVTLLPAALMKLRERRVAPRVTVVSGFSGDLLVGLQRGDLDGALIHEPRDGSGDCSWRPIARQPIVVLAPANAEGDLPALLASLPYIRFNRTAWIAPLIELRLKEMNLAPDASAEIQSIEAIRELVASNFGVSILPRVWGRDQTPGIRTLPFGDPPLHRMIGLITRAGSRRSAARAVGDAFQEAAEAAEAERAAFA